MTDKIKEMVKVIQESKLCYYGIRGGRHQNVGDIVAPSHDWDYENDRESEDLLPGACSTGINNMFDDDKWLEEKIAEALKINNEYSYNHQYLVGGHDSEYGSDPGELIIVDAQVLYIIK